MDDIKFITICGSMRFKKEMMEIAEDLELKKGYAVIQCVSGVGTIYDKEAKDKLGRLHFKKIDISDAIYVVNVGGYIGESTKKEIAYARKHQKEIFSLEPLEL